MKYLSLVLACGIMGCTTVNVYTESTTPSEPVIIIKPSVKNPNNPYYNYDVR